MLLSWLVSISPFAVFEPVSCFFDASCDVIDPIFHFVLVVICFHCPFQMKGCSLGLGRQSCCVRSRAHELVHSFLAVFLFWNLLVVSIMRRGTLLRVVRGRLSKSADVVHVPAPYFIEGATTDSNSFSRCLRRYALLVCSCRCFPKVALAHQIRRSISTGSGSLNVTIGPKYLSVFAGGRISTISSFFFFAHTRRIDSMSEQVKRKRTTNKIPGATAIHMSTSDSVWRSGRGPRAGSRKQSCDCASVPQVTCGCSDGTLSAVSRRWSAVSFP